MRDRETERQRQRDKETEKVILCVNCDMCYVGTMIGQLDSKIGWGKGKKEKKKKKIIITKLF